MEYMSTVRVYRFPVSDKTSSLHVLSSNTNFCLKGGTVEASLIEEICQ